MDTKKPKQASQTKPSIPEGQVSRVQDWSDKEVVIRLKDINKTFFIREKGADSLRDKVFGLFSSNGKKEIKAVEDFNLEVRKGEFLGIIGRNGCGKSTLLKIIMGAIRPDKGGEVTTYGRMMRLSLGMGFDAKLTARENVYINASILGLTIKEVDEKFDEIIEFAELQNFIDTPVKFYSRGMKSRLGFATAVHADADIFLMDEFFGGVGDVNFKKKSEDIFAKSFIEGRTIIHVSHNMGSIRQHCDRVVLMEKGTIHKIGTPDEVIPVYKDLMGQKNAKSKKRGKNQQGKKSKGQESARKKPANKK